jgi:hypothetical protein
MRTFFMLFLLLFLFACAKPPIKPVKPFPEYSTEVTDPQIGSIYREFMDLSKRNNITFKHDVSIGFTKIDDGDVIGTCSYRMTFREIDLDKDFWSKASWFSKTSLLYHELTHCYCNRDHDFGEGKLYPDDSVKYLLQSFFKKTTFSIYKPEGYFDDNCPVSLMHPKLISDDCMRYHYNEYVEEMFKRCQPY